MDVELLGATFELLVDHGQYIETVVFVVEKFGIGQWYSSVCSCREVQAVSVYAVVIERVMVLLAVTTLDITECIL